MEQSVWLAAALEGVHALNRAPGMEVVRDVCGLQAQFSRNPPLALRLRASDYDPARWSDRLVKVWAQRGTIHVVRADELGLFLSAAGQGGAFRDGWWGMTAAQQEAWAPFLEEQIAQGNDTRDGLKRACRAHGMDEALLRCAFHGWGGLIKELAWRGRIVCSPGTEKRYSIPGRIEWLDRDDARRALIRRYFFTFGPATLRDCAAFFGWPWREMKPLFDEILPELRWADLGGVRYWHGRPLEARAEIPPCVLLPGFDSLVMAYRDRTRLIDPVHARKLVNAAGIVFPAVLLRGRVRARWKLEGGKISVVPFERLLKKDAVAIRRASRQSLGVADVAVEENG